MSSREVICGTNVVQHRSKTYPTFIVRVNREVIPKVTWISQLPRFVVKPLGFQT